MNNTKIKLIFSLVVPVIILVALTLVKKNIYNNGREVTLNIEAYDPRDLISGHYLTYTIKYDVDSVCPSKEFIHEAYICLEPKGFSLVEPINCIIKIKGHCYTNNRFFADLERFYIPESRAKDLTEKVRNKNASIVVGVMPDGHAVVKDLLIDGKSWKE